MDGQFFGTRDALNNALKFFRRRGQFRDEAFNYIVCPQIDRDFLLAVGTFLFVIEDFTDDC